MINTPGKIFGKTYSLFGNENYTGYFYKFVEEILDLLLGKYEDELSLLDIIRKSGKREKNYISFTDENICLKESESVFKSYTPGVTSHRKEQSVFKFRKSIMRLEEWQYHMYMLEFVLVNRINKNKFLKCDLKIALLPHCLRDLTRNCMAEVNGFDYQCRHCSKNCFINEASKMLSDNNIEPYIWMSANLISIAKQNHKKTLGVLGIACIPELIRGMRNCQKKNLPVVGIPLDANRCVRWMGEFNPNSVNLEILGLLISKREKY